MTSHSKQLTKIKSARQMLHCRPRHRHPPKKHPQKRNDKKVFQTCCHSLVNLSGLSYQKCPLNCPFSALYSQILNASDVFLIKNVVIAAIENILYAFQSMIKQIFAHVNVRTTFVATM